MPLPRLNLLLIAGLLLGYVFLDRGFAYIGFSSIFVGEVVLAISLMIALITPANLRFLGTPAGYTLLAFLFWSVSILLLHRSGVWVNALRDSVVWAYGLYAILVASLLLRTRSIEASVDWYARWMPWFAAWAAPALVLQAQLKPILPTIYEDVSILTLKAGDVSTHLAGAIAFLILGLHREYPRQSEKWSLAKEAICYCGLLLAFVTAGSRNRGGLISVLIAIVVVTIFRPNNRLARLVLPATIVASFLVAFDVNIPTGAGREISVNQIVENVQSVVGSSEKKVLRGSVNWRLEWWDAIVDDTIYGDRFWYGSGFGHSLAKQFGFADTTGNRSPHNGHLTILARSGVPGFALWLILILTIYTALARCYFTALSRNEVRAAKINLWIMAYLTAMLVNMSFDVYLEGPQGGIWFWCLSGYAIALTYAQRLNMAQKIPNAERRINVASSSPGVSNRR